MRAVHLSFWAKTLRAEKPPKTYKPVAHHALDVGAVALEYLLAHPARLAREARLTGLAPQGHATFCAFLASLHDLGKVSIRHQRLVPELYPTDVLGPMLAERSGPGHWRLTAVLLRSTEVAQALGFETQNDDAARLIAAIAGHHGEPTTHEHTARDIDAARDEHALGPTCTRIAAELVADLKALFQPPEFSFAAMRMAPFTFTLNGLITLADWVGSDDTRFTFQDRDMPLGDYFARARATARQALHDKGLMPKAANAAIDAASIIGNHAARPMQQAAQNVLLTEGPQLILIEDGTGSGKTEAALILARRMMRAGLGEGIYFALPTMATANAMEKRLGGLMPHLFDEQEGNKASFVLSHAKAELTRGLNRLASSQSGDSPQDDASQDDAVSDRLNRWIADSRKLAFFADAGVGTLDQALIGVLPRKHLALRQYALAGRILIVDEAHAYDVFTGTELEVLLESHAAHGGSAIVLTATLTLDKRAALATAFRNGARAFIGAQSDHRNRNRQVVLSATDYPLLTHVSAATQNEQHVPASLARSVDVQRIHDRAAALAFLRDAAGQGAACAMICNAVDEAIAMHGALLAAGHAPEKLTLFHARMALGDRLTVERDVLERFGKASTPAIRQGQILVATQVVEQSLDLDFDAMVSDLAPADLLIQRAGRLHRHGRDARPVMDKTLHIIAPDPAPGAVGQKEWLKDTLGAASYTYAGHVNWRSATALFAAGCIATPGGLRALVEAAYAKAVELPDALKPLEKVKDGEDGAHRSLAQINTITPSAGYALVGQVSDRDDLGTRLGEETVTLRLLKRDDQGRLYPWAGRPGSNQDSVLSAALSELSVRRKWFCGNNAAPLPVPAADTQLQAIKAGWPEWEQHIALYEVGADGHLVFADSGGTRFSYSATQGLVKHQAHAD